MAPISADDILKQTGLQRSDAVRNLEPVVQKWAMKLAYVLGGAIFLVTGFILYQWRAGTPGLPVTTGLTADQLKVALDGYRELSGAALDSATKVFDLVVVKAFLPVFASILGYIFGTLRSEKGGS